MNLDKIFLIYMMIYKMICVSPSHATYEDFITEEKTIPIIQAWQGDYPISELNRLPEGQRLSRNGYLGNQFQFSQVWKAFKPSGKVPYVDFNEFFIIFSRNVTFYNRNSILKVVLKEGVIEPLVRETMSSMPIEKKVAMSMALVHRSGVNFIAAGKELIPVESSDHGVVSDPMNTSYNIEGQTITLDNGYSEVVAAPGSAIKSRTSILGDVVEGDLDSDGDEDGAVILLHDPGGSGTFYYIAVAEKMNGQYRGSNAVLLGDRIVPTDLLIQNGLVTAKYAARGYHESMGTPVSVETSIHLAFDERRLKVLKTLGKNYQIVDGWVTIGHEVRIFHPCHNKDVFWLSGNSPCLADLVTRYNEIIPDKSAYTPLFVTLAGRFDEVPGEGFGMDYEGAFFASELVGVRPEGKCLFP